MKFGLSAAALMLLNSSFAAAWTNGLNMPWVNCGNDWGTDYNSNVFAADFKKYKASGADSVRYWIHFDGNKQLKLFDNRGYFKELPRNFYADALDTFRLAKQHGLKLHLTMFSFECVNNDNCHQMMADNSKSNAYIKNGL